MRKSLCEDFVRVKTPMGILVVWSWKKFSSKFSILSDLLRNLKLPKIKLCSFFPGQQLTYMKNYFDTIEELPTGSHLKKFKNWCQNAYGCKTNYKFIFGPFFFTEQTLRSIPLDVLPNATENVIRPYQNLRNSLLILKSLKKYLKFTISNYSKIS